jgi:hypothetical protein
MRKPEETREKENFKKQNKERKEDKAKEVRRTL